MELKYNVDIKRKSPLETIMNFDFFKRDQNLLLFQYSIYINGTPGSEKTEHREIKDTNDLFAFYNDLESIINNLGKREELAIHSVVIKDGIKYHIPMIDFATPMEGELFESMDRLQEEYNYEIYLFKSGRSYHGYLNTLLTDDDWKKFLGRLLLLNKTKAVTDSRWIGHSLRHEFSSLRLSCNTPLYLSYPTYWQFVPKKAL